MCEYVQCEPDAKRDGTAARHLPPGRPCQPIRPDHYGTVPPISRKLFGRHPHPTQSKGSVDRRRKMTRRVSRRGPLLLRPRHVCTRSLQLVALCPKRTGKHAGRRGTAEPRSLITADAPTLRMKGDASFSMHARKTPCSVISQTRAHSYGKRGQKLEGAARATTHPAAHVKEGLLTKFSIYMTNRSISGLRHGTISGNQPEAISNRLSATTLATQACLWRPPRPTFSRT